MKLKRIIALLIILQFQLFGITNECKSAEKINKISEITNENIKCVLEIMSEKTNQKLPIQIDAITTLEAEKNIMNYKYKIFNNPSKEETKIIAKDMKILLKKNNCENKLTKTLLEKGMKINHNYYSFDLKFLFNIKIDKEMCQN
jgi:hypothetical protein